MHLAKTTFSDTAIFIEKKTVKNWLWAKSDFLWARKKSHEEEGNLRLRG